MEVQRNMAKLDTISRLHACRHRPLGIALMCCLLWSFGAVATPGEPNLDADPHLMGWWKFDENTGTEAADSSKHGRIGKLSGKMTFDDHSVVGRSGKALSFDGGDDLVTITGYKGVTGTAPRTVSLWLKTKTPKGDLVSWGTKDFGKMWIVRFIRGHVGATPNGGYYYMADNIHDEKWHQVAVVVGKAELPNLHDDVTLYLDGKKTAIDPIGLLDLWPIETGDDSEVVIGQKFNGAIDELRIYDRALSEEEVAVLHNMGK
jgi:hypothetical protein